MGAKTCLEALESRNAQEQQGKLDEVIKGTRGYVVDGGVPDSTFLGKDDGANASEAALTNRDWRNRSRSRDGKRKGSRSRSRGKGKNRKNSRERKRSGSRKRSPPRKRSGSRKRSPSRKP